MLDHTNKPLLKRQSLAAEIAFVLLVATFALAVLAVGIHYGSEFLTKMDPLIGESEEK